MNEPKKVNFAYILKRREYTI